MELRGMTERGWTAWTVVLLAGAGCTRESRLHVELSQPRAGTAAERKLSLESDAAWYNVEGGRASYLLEIPLPGARTGAQYRVYLRLSDGQGRHVIGTPVASGGFEAGFLVHLKGRGAGLTEGVSGYVEVASEKANERSGELSLRFADGSNLTGRFIAIENADRLRQYERDAPEVQPLLRGAGR